MVICRGSGEGAGRGAAVDGLKGTSQRGRRSAVPTGLAAPRCSAHRTSNPSTEPALNQSIFRFQSIQQSCIIEREHVVCAAARPGRTPTCSSWSCSRAASRPNPRLTLLPPCREAAAAAAEAFSWGRRRQPPQQQERRRQRQRQQQEWLLAGPVQSVVPQQQQRPERRQGSRECGVGSPCTRSTAPVSAVRSPWKQASARAANRTEVDRTRIRRVSAADVNAGTSVISFLQRSRSSRCLRGRRRDAVRRLLNERSCGSSSTGGGRTRAHIALLG